MTLKVNNLTRLSLMAAFGFAAAALSTNADAVVFNFAGLSGSGSGDVLHASVEFQVSGSQLTVIVTNTDDNAAFNGADVLSSVYWNMAGSPTVSNGQAALTAGSNLVLKNNAAPGATNPLNNEWFWKSPSSAGTQYAFGATGAIGFNRFESFDAVFHGGSGSGGATDDYGIVPTGGQTAGSNTNVYANNSMTFTFDLSAPISENDISNVFVSYGSGAATVLVPEPATMGALAIGAIALLRRRNRK